MHRASYLAGRWYPHDERECRAAIEGHAAIASPEQGPWRALIGPHAGWTYSGNAAGQTYRWLAGAHPEADLVVVFGEHRGPRGPSTILLAEGWETPLGNLQNAQRLAETLADELNLDEEPARPINPDNASELHMPFVKHFFPEAELLMLGVEASPRAIEIGRKVAAAAQGANRDVLFVGSTDLTHYGTNYGFSPRGSGKAAVDWVRNENDQGFIERVLVGDARGVLQHAADHASACCAGAAAACIAAAQAVGSGEARLVDHYLSYDVQPGPSFVGYAGIVL